jgi:hypothetical protein
MKSLWFFQLQQRSANFVCLISVWAFSHAIDILFRGF